MNPSPGQPPAAMAQRTRLPSLRFEKQQFQPNEHGEAAVKSYEPQPSTLGKGSEVRIRPEVRRSPAHVTPLPELFIQTQRLREESHFRQSQEFPAFIPCRGWRQDLSAHDGPVRQMPQKCQLRHAAKGRYGSRLVFPISLGPPMVGVGLCRQRQPDISVQKIGGAWQGLLLPPVLPAIPRSGSGWRVYPWL